MRHFMINNMYRKLHIEDHTYHGKWVDLDPESPPVKGDFVTSNTSDFADTVAFFVPRETGTEFSFPYPLPASPDYEQIGETTVVMDGGRFDDFRQKRIVYRVL